jgi:hypothetical protein
MFFMGCSSVSIASVWYPCRGCCYKIWLDLWTLLCMMPGVGWLAVLTRLRVTGVFERLGVRRAVCVKALEGY